MRVVLYFTCNLDVVARGGGFCSYLAAILLSPHNYFLLKLMIWTSQKL